MGIWILVWIFGRNLSSCGTVIWNWWYQGLLNWHYWIPLLFEHKMFSSVLYGWDYFWPHLIFCHLKTGPVHHSEKEKSCFRMFGIQIPIVLGWNDEISPGSIKQDFVVLSSVNVDNKSDSTGIFLVGRIVQPVGLGQTPAVGLKRHRYDVMTLLRYHLQLNLLFEHRHLENKLFFVMFWLLRMIKSCAKISKM